jgi:phenylalanyl-tRNA synthetase beta chain
MDIKLSYNWLKEYIKTNLTVNEFAKKMSIHGPSIERWNYLGKNLENVVAGKILSIEKHAESEKLNIAQVDVGTGTKQIVFGSMAKIEVGNIIPTAVAPTILAGDREIKIAEVKGVKSEGMLCLNSELGISEEDKITYFDESTKTGQSIKDLLGLDDYALSIEITTNRIDALSIMGIAREASSILNTDIIKKDFEIDYSIKNKLPLAIEVLNKDLCKRYQAVVIENIKVEDSPIWIKQRLLASGIRPINNVVDITNYVMLEYGQPLHAYDYDKVNGNTIKVRNATEGEEILALDGNTYKFKSHNLVIADVSNPVGIAGIMGGELSSVSTNTTRIILECANFDKDNIRRASTKDLVIRTDAANIYEKGISPECTYESILRTIELLQKVCGGNLSSEIYDIKDYVYKDKYVDLAISEVERYIGIRIETDRIIEILTKLGFECNLVNENNIKVKVPYYRVDIDFDYDLVEEVARIYGYYNIPVHLPEGEIPNRATPWEFIIEDSAKNVLAHLGLTETYAYSLISEKILKLDGIGENAMKVINPLNVDFEYMRVNLANSLLNLLSENEKFSKELNLFELSKVYLPQGENELPYEQTNLGLAMSGYETDELFGRLKGVFETLLNYLSISISKIEYKRISESKLLKPTAGAFIYLNGENIGQLGIVKDRVKNELKLKKKSSGILEINFEKIIAEAKVSSKSFIPIPKFPSILMDLSITIYNKIAWSEVQSIVMKNGSEFITSVELFDTYKGKNIGEGKKSISFHIEFKSDDRTLDQSEVDTAVKSIVEALKSNFNALVRE